MHVCLQKHLLLPISNIHAHLQIIGVGLENVETHALILGIFIYENEDSIFIENIESLSYVLDGGGSD